MNNLRVLIPFLFLIAGSFNAFGQEIVAEKTFPVTGYQINQVGYPFKAVAGDDNGFVYIEYWERGQGRKFPNYYIQGYNKRFEEEWFHPLTEDKQPPMQPEDLIRLKNSIAVIGTQYDATIKGPKTMMQVYDLRGDHKGGLMKISNFDKKAKKGFVNEQSLSPDSTLMLWLGTNPEDNAKKRRYFLSVWSEEARNKWAKELILPHSDEGYLASQVKIDNRGNAYFLMKYEEMTNTEKDTVHLPWILRYDYRENKFTEYQPAFPGASVPTGEIHLTREGDLAFLAILSDGSEGGFLNGAKSFGTALKWNKIVFKTFEIERELKLRNEYLMDIPAGWQEKYGERGGNFSRSEVREVGNDLFWVMEENYTQTHNDRLQHLFYDVAIISMNKKSGEITWANSFEKKQRDYERGNLLSYVLGISGGKLRFVYLNERGAQGKILCTSVDKLTGETENKTLAKNQQANYLFFPARSSMIGTSRMLLMGIGNPVGNDYKLILVAFPGM